MKKRFFLCSFIFLFSIFIAGGTAAAADTSPDYEAVKKSIEQSIGWAIEKDFDAMFRLWADNMFHFWLFSDSTVVGLDNFKKYAEQWKDPDFRGHPLRIQGPAHRVFALRRRGLVFLLPG